MKLFDLQPEEKHGVRTFLLWHFGYVLYVALFSLVIFQFGLFKSYWFLKEVWILNLLAPMHTLAFVLPGPYRRNWIGAVVNMYRTLDGDPIFFFMSMLVFGLGLYLYTVIIWGLGGLLPSIFFNT